MGVSKQSETVFGKRDGILQRRVKWGVGGGEVTNETQT